MISEKNQRWLVAAVFVFVVGVLALGVMFLQKIERLVVIAERTEQKIDTVAESAASLGKTTVDKGTAMIDSVDPEEIIQTAEENIKELSSAAKQRLIDYMNRNAEEGTENQETGRQMP